MALSLLHGPVLRGAAAAAWGDALGCGCWVPKHLAGRRCSCIDSSGGMRDGCLMRAVIVYAGVAAQGWLAAFYYRLVFLCGGRTAYSAGMFLGVPGSFNSP